MSTHLEVTARRWPGTYRAIWARDRGPSGQGQAWRVMRPALVRLVACAAWLIALASIVSRATGYAGALTRLRQGPKTNEGPRDAVP